MPANTAYITLSELKNSQELVGFAFADYDAQMAIQSASNGVSQYCGRDFGVASGTTTRYYTPQEPGYVNIDDLVTTTSAATVQTDTNGDGVFETTWTLNTDYVLEPMNAQADSWPYEWIRVHPNSGNRFTSWPRSLAVTGSFGWPATPDNIREATMILSVRLLKRAREAPFGVVGGGLDSSPVRIARTDPDIGFLLDNWVRGYGVLVA